MQLGVYKTTVQAAERATAWNKSVAILYHRILDGDHAGVALRQYITIKKVGNAVDVENNPYIEQCEIAIGRQVEPTDNLDPAAVFVGKVFNVTVRYRKTDPRHKKAVRQEETKKKDPNDKLRVGAT
jgi:hypothetical protein